MYATYSSTLKLLVPACLLEDGVGVELFWCFYFGFGCFGFGFFFHLSTEGLWFTVFSSFKREVSLAN